MQEVMVSIIMRTCNRPHILRNALESVRAQTYKNIEVIIAEDGKDTARQMIETEFSDLNIKYVCTGERKGRTVVGNLALSMATGKYLNFLDDDDLLFHNHVEMLVNSLQGAEEKAAYSVAYESVVKYDEKKRSYREYKRFVRFNQPFNRIYLLVFNFLPIQTIMFERSLYEQLGGFDENLDVLEDWDLWVRYSTLTDYKYVNEITSLYRVPKKKIQRDAGMYEAYQKVPLKFKEYGYDLSYYDIHQELNYILNEIKTPGWKRFLKKIRDKTLYR